MRTKDNTVNIADLHPKMQLMLPVLDHWCWNNLGYELIITSACDGRHGQFSRHYIGCAVDMRTWTNENSGKQLERQPRTILRQELQLFLNHKFKRAFQVLDETDHFHIAFKPREPITWASWV